MQDSYAQHIRNRALLSCDGRMTTEELAEYLVEEILRKRCLEWLEWVIDEALSRFSDEEKDLIERYFFGKRQAGESERTSQSESQRTRMQTKCFSRLEAMLLRAGLTKEYFDKELSRIELIGKMYRRIASEENSQSSA